MRNILVLFSFLLVSLSPLGNLLAQPNADVIYCMTSPIGYGAATTGGGANGRVVHVNSVATLRSALQASGAAIIIVTENITFRANDRISARVENKTLLGLNGVKLITTHRDKNGGILQLNANSKNVIIRNLIFEGPGAYDVDGNDLLTNNGCQNLWVDHCEFYDGVDGNFDNVNGADNVSISWCKFGYKIPALAGGSGGSNDHRFTNLIGGNASAAPADGQYSITFQFCYWSDGCKERMPRARNAQLHILNCYYNTNVSGSLALGLEGGFVGGTTCYVEGTDFEKISNVYRSYVDSKEPHRDLPKTLKFVDCLKAGNPNVGVANIGEAPRPTYNYTAIPAVDVKEVVTSACGAGATLHVTLEGVVSAASGCAGIQSPLVTIPSGTKTIKSVLYYDILGKPVTTPTQGLLIVKTMYEDGSMDINKIYRRD